MNEVLQVLDNEIVKNYDEFALADSSKKENCKDLLKKLYEETVLSTTKSFGPFNELYMNVDSDGLWEELQARNKPFLRFAKKKN